MVKTKKVNSKEREQVFEETGRCLICHNPDSSPLQRIRCRKLNNCTVESQKRGPKATTDLDKKRKQTKARVQKYRAKLRQTRIEEYFKKNKSSN